MANFSLHTTDNYFYSLLKRLKNLLNFNYNIYYLIIAVFLQILVWSQAFYLYHHLTGGFITLHYSVDYGIDLVLSSWKVFLWPAFSLILFIINILISLLFYKSKHFLFLFHLLFITSLFINFIIILSLGSVYLINFR